MQNKEANKSIKEASLTNSQPLKKRKVLHAFLIGILVGVFFIAAAAAVKSENALMIIPTFLPLFLLLILTKRSKKS